MGFNTPRGNSENNGLNTSIVNQIHVDGVNVKIVPDTYKPSVVYRIGDGTINPEGCDNVTGEEYLDFYMPYQTSIDDLEISQFLGAYATEPTTRPNGEPIQEGDFYYNTTVDMMYVYDGAVFYKMGTGQYLGNAKVKSVMYLSQTTSENLVVPDGSNAMSIDSLTIEDGGSLTIPDGSIYKIV